MKQTELIMGMPISVEIIGRASQSFFDEVFDYFRQVDAKYSTYKPNSEISKINDGLPKTEWSVEMKSVLELCEQTRQQTKGYFNINHEGKIDPSGLVKGWAVKNAADLLFAKGVNNFNIEAGGDIQVGGHKDHNQKWRIGIRSPFEISDIIKTVEVSNEGIATSGAYIRGQHIYDPFNFQKSLDKVRSFTVIGPNIYEADRFATAAFAMGWEGISFIESVIGLEGYMVTDDHMATYTSGFERYVA
jgi:thiamine biosynthesis lipoprotein